MVSHADTVISGQFGKHVKQTGVIFPNHFWFFVSQAMQKSPFHSPGFDVGFGTGLTSKMERRSACTFRIVLVKKLSQAMS